MKVTIHQDAEKASSDAAKRVLNTLRSTPSPTLMLPTGATPRGLYRKLATVSNPSAWTKASVFALDEYVGVAGDDPESFRFQLWEELCRPLGMRPSQLFTPDGMTDNLDAEAERYEQLVSSHQPLSLTILGVGANGHVAFNEPGTPLDSRTHIATLAAETRKANQGAVSGTVPSRAITVGIATILESSSLLLLAFGKAKRDAIGALIEGTPRTDMPVTALAEHPNLTVLLDQESGSDLKPPGL